MVYHVRLEMFEGPFELLFHLIEKNEIDIYDIPIAKITKEYLEYIRNWQSFDLEIASEFLLMAATLIALKARSLLPKPESEESEEEEVMFAGNEEELRRRLLEYKKFKELSEVLREKELMQGKIYTRNAQEIWEFIANTEPVLEGIELQDLVQAFYRVWENALKENLKEISYSYKTVREKIKEIWEKLRIADAKGVEFHKLFSPPITRGEVIVSFLSVLELIRLKKIKVKQENNFGQIFVFVYDGVSEL